MPPVSVSSSYSNTGAVDCPGQSEWLGYTTNAAAQGAVAATAPWAAAFEFNHGRL